jgi:DNA repair protein RadD
MDLRWYQQEAVDAAYDYLCNEAGNPVVCLPTGSGKSLVIAELARRAVKDYGGRVLILQHRKELIEQNADKVRRLLDIPLGMYSAGLRRYGTEEDVVLCGIQSVYSKATLFDRRNLIIVDEVHLVPNDGEGMYQTFLSESRQINPGVRVIGLTATPFRTGEGALCRPNGMFQKVCYDAPIKRLIEEGFLSPVTNKPNETKFDTSGLHMRYGEFIASELETLFGGSQVAEACKEIVEKTSGRHSVMVFCTTVRHAASVASTLEKLTGESVAMVEGGTMPLERAAIIKAFTEQRIRFLVNVDVLTTGFDAPCVDAICILRATASPGLFSQIVGRGLRVHPSKQDCLVLDFGCNIERHGSIDNIDYGKPKSRKTSEPNDDEERLCPNCEMPIPNRKRTCENCGFESPIRLPNHEQQADTKAEIISTGEPETFMVEGASFSRHQGKPGKLDTLRVSYELVRDGNMQRHISEWVCVEHSGYARGKAEAWWRERCSLPCPDSIDECVDLFRRGWVAVPKSITALREGAFWRVVSAEIEELPVGVEVDEVVEEMPF